MHSDDHGSESPDFNRMTPAPNPGLTWILSSAQECGFREFLFRVVDKLLATLDPNARDHLVQTDPFFVCKGKFTMALRLDLNGYRIQVPGQPAIWLIDEGKKRHIPNPATFNALFRNWEGIVQDINAVDIEDGPAIMNGAILAQAEGDAAVYLVDVHHSVGNVPSDLVKKRHITSPTRMDQYNFRWPSGRVAPILLQRISDGPAI